MTIAAATTGYYRLTFAGATTAEVYYLATAGQIETALEALTTIDNVTVSGSARWHGWGAVDFGWHGVYSPVFSLVF